MIRTGKKLLGLAVFSLATMVVAIAVTGSMASAAAAPNKPVYSISCGPSCSGQPTAKMTACSNPAIAKTVRYFVYVNGHASGSYDVKKGKCASKSVVVADRDVVSSKYCYLNAAATGCVDPRVNIGTPRTVVVPQAVGISINSDMSNSDSTVHYVHINIPAGSAYFAVQILRADGTPIPLTSNGTAYNGFQLGNQGSVDFSFAVSPTEVFNYDIVAYENSAYTVRSGCEITYNISIQ